MSRRLCRRHHHSVAEERTLSSVLALNPLSAHDLLSSFGTIGILVILFAETGLLIGFFLPGDSLLFTAGLLCAAGSGALRLSLPWVLLAAAAGALLGAQTGFWLGRRAGRVMERRSRHPRLLAGMSRAEEMFARYGPAKAIVLARFIPVVRTVLNQVAGALRTPTATFTLWQVVGGLVWTVGLILAGYALGASVPGIDAYLLPVIALVIVVSLIPLVAEILRERRRTRTHG
jgi:membrane-associated protein